MFQLPLDPGPAAPQQVPDLASLEPFAPYWILTVRAKVDSLPTATMPSRMKQGQAQLVQVRERLEGVFEFKVFDRRCHDTRIQETRTA
jgi:mediator of RNA polymerase II transcription subunit 18